MERHGYAGKGAAAALQRAMEEKGVEPLISQVTIRRILKAEARTEPEKDTLRRLAEFMGETYAQAFPEPGQEEQIVEVDGEKVAIGMRAMGGGPLSPATAAKVRRLISVAAAQEVQAAKAKGRRKRT